MQRRRALFVLIVMIVSAEPELSTLGNGVVLAADKCLTQPDLQSPQGVHWYYHTDPVSRRKCWHMEQPGAKVPQTASPVSPSSSKLKDSSRIAQATSVDKADRDALFREFVLWQAQQMGVKPEV
jgi:hypothetical protein